MSKDENLGLYPKNGEVTFMMPSTNALGKLKEAKEGRSLTAKYMTVEDWKELQDQELLCFFIGFKEAVDGDGKPFMLAKLIDSENKPFVAAQTVLCQSLSAAQPGQGVKIICTGIEKAAKGKMATFEVIELDINLFGNE